MQIQLVQEEQKEIENVRELNRLQTEVNSLRAENLELTESLTSHQAQIAQLTTEASEHVEKYNKVKKALFQLRDQT